jgi:hypothetical protein
VQRDEVLEALFLPSGMFNIVVTESMLAVLSDVVKRLGATDFGWMREVGTPPPNPLRRPEKLLARRVRPLPKRLRGV